MSSQNTSKSACNTLTSNRSIIVTFRLTWSEYKKLENKAGGKRKISSFIRTKLGFEGYVSDVRDERNG